MKHVHIKEFLKSIDVSLSDLSLGEFDYIGEYTAKKNRNPDQPLFKSTGCYFRPNYERGILIYSLITKFKLQSFLEIGFGRGYSAVCAAKALYDIGSQGKVTTIDPSFDEQQLKLMSSVFPKEWLEKIVFVKGKSEEQLPSVLHENFDIIYIDGDHRAEGVRKDWELVKNSWNTFCLFDDYHLPTKKEADIECAQVIDLIDWEKENYEEPQVILTDRRIFLDDRGYQNSDIDYGQVLFSKNDTKKDLW